MAQFISQFRGQGTPGSTQFNLQRAEQGRLATERAQAAQPGLLAQDQLKLSGAVQDFERASLIKGAEDISLLSDRSAQLDNLKRRNAEILSRGGNPEHTQEGIQLLEQGIQTGDFSTFDESIQDILSLRGGGEKAGAGQFTIGNQRFDAEGNVIATGAAPVETVTAFDQARINKLNAETAKINAESDNPVNVDALIGDVSDELKVQAKEAFNLSGGGEAGVKAVERVKKAGAETERRAKSPEILANTFPRASAEEMQELQAVMDSAKNTESGLKEAGKLRETQRQVKIGNETKKRGLELIELLLANDELDDVIGSREGEDKGIIPFTSASISGGEADAIADIKELESILTAGSLKLMSGVLSESDIGILTRIAAGGLTRTRTEKRFRGDIIRIKDALSRELGSDKLTTKVGRFSVKVVE